MEIKIKTTNIEITEYLKKLVNSKAKKIDKLLSDYSGLILEVELDKTTKHHQKGDIFRAEMQVQVPKGKLLRSVSKKENFRSSLSEAEKDLIIQIKKYKDKNSLELRRKL
ncbi:MAG: ribosome-associated translation inhibitor RaiA [Candidatus Pacebacteria bacterium]|nr:ribosome-associated translation inhibitor RaiA [Candidatus Paceibacterota bacterium]